MGRQILGNPAGLVAETVSAIFAQQVELPVDCYQMSGISKSDSAAAAGLMHAQCIWHGRLRYSSHPNRKAFT